MKLDFIKLHHRRIAQLAVGPSTARGMGPKGTIQKARDFLQALDLHRFQVKSEKAFQRVLETVTLELKSALPRTAQRWGSARKFLNIFLRDVLYNRYLCEAYRFKHLEPWLELPLDSHVARGLKSEPTGQHLPRWETVVGLTSKQSQEYQNFAAQLANQLRTHRIHLDLKYWRDETNKKRVL